MPAGYITVKDRMLSG